MNTLKDIEDFIEQSKHFFQSVQDKIRNATAAIILRDICPPYYMDGDTLLEKVYEIGRDVKIGIRKLELMAKKYKRQKIVFIKTKALQEVKEVKDVMFDITNKTQELDNKIENIE
jgi:hypothetical protein